MFSILMKDKVLFGSFGKTNGAWTECRILSKESRKKALVFYTRGISTDLLREIFIGGV